MSKAKWEQTIKKACEGVGTYRPEFDSIISILADNRDKRDKAAKQFKKSGGNSVIPYVNKAGAKNLVKNPLLVVINDLDATALAYWRDLGLTPAGLKKVSNGIVNTGATSVNDILNEIGF